MSTQRQRMRNLHATNCNNRPKTCQDMARNELDGDGEVIPRPVTVQCISSDPDNTNETTSTIQSRPSGTRKKLDIQRLNHAISLFSAKQYHRAYPIFDELGSKHHSIPAMYHKAIMTFDGMGTAESAREGVLLLKKVYAEATRTGTDTDYKHLACYQIGQAYEQGVGARQDRQEAVKWWLLAASEVKYDPQSPMPIEEQLVTDAGTKCQILLAHHFAQLPTPDYAQSYTWYREAGQNGSAESMLQVALMEWYGLSPTDDDTDRRHTITTFLTQAAHAGNLCAMGNLAVFSLLHQHQQPAFHWASKVIDLVDHRTLGQAVDAIRATVNNENTQEAMTKSIAMAYFVLAHLHNVGAVATLDKEKAVEFYEAACAIDIYLVQALENLLENDSQLLTSR